MDLFAWCVRLNRLKVGFRTHLKSLHFHFISLTYSLIFLDAQNVSDRRLNGFLYTLYY